jgi:hypothetical protein
VTNRLSHCVGVFYFRADVTCLVHAVDGFIYADNGGSKYL